MSYKSMNDNLTLQLLYNNIDKFLLIFLLTMVTSCSSGDQQKNDKKNDDQSESQVLISEPFQLSSYSGKKLLVVYWATWCSSCIEESPTLIAIQRKYGGDSFTVIGVSVDQSPYLVEKFISKRGINYPVYIEDESLKEIFGTVFGLPTIYLVAETGEFVQKITGKISEKALHKTVKKFIMQEPVKS
jgi:thiol-disulfide isomerase/thioredoxin